MPDTFDRLGLLWWHVADGVAEFRAARTGRRLMKRSKFTDEQILAIVKEREAGLLARILPSASRIRVPSVGVEELDLQLCAGFIAALGQTPQSAAHVAAKVHRRTGPRQDRLLRRSAGTALGRRCATEGIATVLLDVKARGIMHSSSNPAFKGGAARQTRRRQAEPSGKRGADVTTIAGECVGYLTVCSRDCAGILGKTGLVVKLRVVRRCAADAPTGANPDDRRETACMPHKGWHEITGQRVAPSRDSQRPLEAIDGVDSRSGYGSGWRA